MTPFGSSEEALAVLLRFELDNGAPPDSAMVEDTESGKEKQ